MDPFATSMACEGSLPTLTGGKDITNEKGKAASIILEFATSMACCDLDL